MKQPGIKKFKISQLKKADYNPRTITKDAMEGLTNSIKRFGLVEPIVVNTRGGKNTIIGGHQRLKALKKLKQKEAICITVSATKAEEKMLNVTLNNPAIQGEFIETIEKYIAELMAEIDDDAAMVDLRIKELIGEIEDVKEGLTEDDAIPELPEKPVTKKGELYILGEHRLLCGDSTKAEDVERLMDGKKADMVFTDPPYGANISGIMQDVHGANLINRTRSWEQIKGDEKTDEALQEFLELAFKNFDLSSKNNAAWYIWHAMLTQGFFAAAAAADLILHRQIIWVKPVLILAFGDYHWRHELCFYGWKKGKRAKFYGPKNSNTVWEIDFDGKGRMPKDERKSPTQKPVNLAIKAIENISRKKESVLDGFLGAGTTMIACEKLGRRCFGMEIDEHYCDVIVKRWEDFTGKKAVLQRARTKKK